MEKKLSSHLQCAISASRECCGKPLDLHSARETPLMCLSKDQPTSVCLVILKCGQCKRQFFPSYSVHNSTQTWDIARMNNADVFVPTRDRAYSREFMEFLEISYERGKLNSLSTEEIFNELNNAARASNARRPENRRTIARALYRWSFLQQYACNSERTKYVGNLTYDQDITSAYVSHFDTLHKEFTYRWVIVHFANCSIRVNGRCAKHNSWVCDCTMKVGHCASF